MDWRNFAQRVAVAIVAIPILLYLMAEGKLWFMLLLEVIIVVGLHEFYTLAHHKQARPQSIIGLIGGAAVAPMIYYLGIDRLWLLLMAVAIVSLITELYKPPKQNSGPLRNVSITLFGILYVAGLLSFLLLIRELPLKLNSDYGNAGTWIIMIFGVIWICDTAAYFVGLYFGKRKLFERVSPKKTIEGAIGGIAFAVISAIACQSTFVRGLSLTDAVVIGVVIGIFGQMSDLIESLFKRDAGIKDSSSLIPGHGGVLDRFDSQMLVAPLVYFYLIATRM